MKGNALPKRKAWLISLAQPRLSTVSVGTQTCFPIMATTAGPAGPAAAAAQNDDTHRSILCYFVESSTSMHDQAVHQYLDKFAGRDHDIIQPGTWRKAIDYAYERFNPINDEVSVMFLSLCQFTSAQPDAITIKLPKSDGIAANIPVVPVQDATWFTGDEAVLRDRLVAVVRGTTVKKALRTAIGVALAGKIEEIHGSLDRLARDGFDAAVGLSGLDLDAWAGLVARDGRAGAGSGGPPGQPGQGGV